MAAFLVDAVGPAISWRTKCRMRICQAGSATSMRDNAMRMASRKAAEVFPSAWASTPRRSFKSLGSQKPRDSRRLAWQDAGP